MQKLFQVCKVLQSSKLVEYVFRLCMILSSFFLTEEAIIIMAFYGFIGQQCGRLIFIYIVCFLLPTDKTSCIFVFQNGSSKTKVCCKYSCSIWLFYGSLKNISLAAKLIPIFHGLSVIIFLCTSKVHAIECFINFEIHFWFSQYSKIILFSSFCFRQTLEVFWRPSKKQLNK